MFLKTKELNRAFTFVEIIVTVVIVAILATTLMIFIPNFVTETKLTADEETLEVLNKALEYYKTVGGDVEGLTQESSVEGILAKLTTPITHWGTTYQFIKPGTTFDPADIEVTGYGPFTRFTRYDTYSSIGGNIPAPHEMAAKSASAEITYLESYTPSIYEGGIAQNYQMSWIDDSSWQALGSYTPAGAGTYEFWVRNTPGGDEVNTTAAGPYILLVHKANQPSVTSSDGSIVYGSSFIPSTSGGAGTGDWRMYWTDIGFWQSLALRTPAAVGSYTFRIQREGDSNYNESSQSALYTLSVTKALQAAVSSSSESINCGGSFTPSISGGSGTGAYQMSWGDSSSWQSVAAYTPEGTGAYSFYARRLGDSNYEDSSTAGPYTLTVNALSQAAVSSTGGTITYGGSFTPVVTGGSGTGTYQVSWGDQSSWGSVAAYAPNAGLYTFYARRLGSGCYNISSNAGPYTLTVNKANQAAVSSADGTITYGDSFTPSTSGGSGTGGWQMYWTDVGSWQTLAARTGLGAGSYTFRVKKLADSNYNESAQSALYTLTVNKASQATVSSSNGSIIYGSAFTPSTSGGSGTGAWQMYWTDVAAWQSLAARSLGAGSYTFRVRKLGDSNYNTSLQSALYTLTVGLADQAAVSSSNATITYESSFMPSTSGGSGTGAWQMYWTDVGSWQSLAARGLGAGSYTFRVKKLADSNYNESAQSALYTLTVNKADQATVSSGNGTITYGSSFTPSTNGGSGSGGWQMYWTDVGSWQTLASRSGLGAGSYTFRVKKLADPNYNESTQSALYTLTVNKANQAAVSSGNGSVTYGSSFTPSVSGGSGTGGWQMYWTDVGSWQTRASRTLNAGSYTFRVKKLGDSNYNESAQSALYTLTVGLANQAAVSSSSATITYGSSFTPSTSGGSGTGGWQMYWTDVGSWQTLAARSLGAGSYTFRVRKLGDSNYNTSSQSALYTLTVNKANQAAVSSGNGSVTYGSSFTPATSGGSGTGGWQMYWTDVGSWQSLAARGLGAGSYTFRVKRLGDSNYNESSQSGLYTLTVNKANQAAVASSNGSVTYGSSFTPAVSGGSGTGGWQMYWTDVGSWQTRASRTLGAGSYTFRVRRLGDSNYNTSSQSGLYTLTVGLADQAAVSSSNATITYGSSFTPSTSGGSGTGGWQMYWTDVGSWQTLAARSLGAGSYTFRVRKLGDSNYNTSSQSALYTLTVNKANQAAVSSSNGSVTYGSSFTPAVSGGSGTGGWQMYWTDVGSWQTRASRTLNAGSYTFRVKRLGDSNYNESSQSGLYTLTVNKANQAAVASSNGSVTYGSSFTPAVSGGSGTGGWQMYWTDVGSWQTRASRTLGAGSYTFRVKKLGDSNYNESSQSALYTLSVGLANQAAVSSSNASISCGGSFTPSVSGGSGTGGWQMYWTDVGSWQTRASRTFSSAGSYTFRVRKLGDSNYNTSAQSSLYTLTVNLLSQSSVSSSNGSINCGSGFTPSVSGGNEGTWQMYWTDVGSWQTRASRTFSSPGSYTFRVRRAASGCYNTSSQSGLYTLTVNSLTQSAVSSANGVINKGSSFTPSVSGGNAGTWQMLWSDIGSWQTLAGRTFSSSGTYTFRVRRAASGCYTTSSQSGLYTLYVKSNSVISQNYTSIGGCCGCFTLRQYIAGEYGTSYGPHNSTLTQLYIADSKYGTWSGQSVRGFIYPPATGTYTFKYRGFEYCDLWVGSAGGVPDDYSRYAYLGGSSGKLGSSGESSFTVSMVAGQRYPFVFYHTNWEMTSGDYAYVKWSGPGVSEAYVGSTYLSQYPE